MGQAIAANDASLLGGATWREVAQEAWHHAIVRLRALLGDDPSAWAWGVLHRTKHEHPSFRRVPGAHGAAESSAVAGERRRRDASARGIRRRGPIHREVGFRCAVRLRPHGLEHLALGRSARVVRPSGQPALRRPTRNVGERSHVPHAVRLERRGSRRGERTTPAAQIGLRRDGAAVYAPSCQLRHASEGWHPGARPAHMGQRGGGLCLPSLASKIGLRRGGTAVYAPSCQRRLASRCATSAHGAEGWRVVSVVACFGNRAP